MELIQFDLRKSGKCESLKRGQHAKYERGWDVYFTDSHLIWCHYARATLQEEKERGEQKDRDLHATKPPWGVWVFLAFQCDAMVRPRVWPWLLSAASPTQTQFKTRGWEAPSSLTIFSIFCLTVMGNVWKHALCDFESLVRGRIPLTDGSVSSDDCCPRLLQMEDAGDRIAVAFERRAFATPSFWT